MKIERGYQKYQQNELPQVTHTTKTSTKSNDMKQVAFDLSETTKNLQKSAKTLDQSPINSEKVAALKAAIKNGTYKVDADVLAKKMLGTEE